FEPGNGLVEEAVCAQSVVLEQRDRGEVEQRARDGFALADLAADLERGFELRAGGFVAVLPEQRAAELEMLEALVRPIAERIVDRERFLGSVLRGRELAQIIEETGIRTDDR